MQKFKKSGFADFRILTYKETNNKMKIIRVFVMKKIIRKLKEID